MEVIVILDKDEKKAFVSIEWPKYKAKAEAAGWKLKQEFNDVNGKPRRWVYEVPIKQIGLRFKNPNGPKRRGNPNFKGRKPSKTSLEVPSSPQKSP